MKKKIVSMLLAVGMVVSFMGCGGQDKDIFQGGSNTTDGNAADAVLDGSKADDSAGNSTGDGSGSAAMGRYVEQETEFLENEEIMGMYRLEDGSLVVPTMSSGFFFSQDGGEIWENESPDWYTELAGQDTWIPGMAVTTDGTVCVIYPDEYESIEDYRNSMMLVAPDGTRTDVVFPEKETGYPCDIFVTKEGRIFVSMVGSTILYEVFGDGRSEAFLETEYRVERLCTQGNLMIFDRYADDGYEMFFYDMNQKEYVQDDVLSEFLSENYKDRYYNGSYDGAISFFAGEDQVLYIAGKKGLHRHALGGNMMEQIIDGNLSMLSNPYYRITGMFYVEGDSFLALFTNGRLIRFTYDAAVPTVPAHMLTVYSLQENDLIRQMVSVYQAGQQEVFVNYEVGMEEGGSVSRDDAIRKLNTEIMAGEGPDLLVMDGLPIDSYVEKGLLLDLTEYFTQYSAKVPLFDNIIDALKIGGKAYMAPGCIQLPMVIGREQYVKRISDLSSVADAVEQIREDNPEKNILDICTGAGVLKRFSCVSEPLWQKEDGSLDRAVLEEYLTACRRIYAAQMDGLDEGILGRMQERNIRVQNYTGISMDMLDLSLGMEKMDYAYGNVLLPFGWAANPYDYVGIMSANRQEGCEDTVVLPMTGQCSNVFMPQTMLAVSAASAQTEEAKGFMDVFLSAGIQSDSYLPVNRAAFQEAFTPNTEWLGEDGSYGGEAASWGDGTEQQYTNYWLSDEQLADLQRTYEMLSVAYISDSVLEEAVFEWGEAYLNGQQSLEEALDGIEKAVSIYMAE